MQEKITDRKQPTPQEILDFKEYWRLRTEQALHGSTKDESGQTLASHQSARRDNYDAFRRDMKAKGMHAGLIDINSLENTTYCGTKEYNQDNKGCDKKVKELIERTKNKLKKNPFLYVTANDIAEGINNVSNGEWYAQSTIG